MMDEDRLEFKRQMIHLLNGSAIAAAVYFLKPMFGLWVLAPLVAALALLHTVPRIHPEHRIANHLMYHFERRNDIQEFPFKGAIFYGLGIIFPIVLLEVNYAVAVILILSVGDSVSTMVGRRYGKTRIFDKSVEGTLAFTLSSWIVASLLVGPVHGLVLALAGAVIELFSLFDDNVTIPLGLTLLALVI